MSPYVEVNKPATRRIMNTTAFREGLDIRLFECPQVNIILTFAARARVSHIECGHNVHQEGKILKKGSGVVLYF